LVLNEGLAIGAQALGITSQKLKHQAGFARETCKIDPLLMAMEAVSLRTQRINVGQP
jgi:hypothetical protein